LQFFDENTQKDKVRPFHHIMVDEKQKKIIMFNALYKFDKTVKIKYCEIN
jgi:hypothetical protein